MAKTSMPIMAKQIVHGLGGTSNLESINHCATRLRVNVIDPEKVEVPELKKITGVMGVELKGNYCQVIVGSIIEDLFLAVEAVAGKKLESSSGKKSVRRTPGELAQDFLLMVSDIISPVIPTLITAGFIATLLAIMQLLFHVDTTDSTYQILNNFAQAAFYFLPVFVAYTAAKKFGTEPVLAMLLACGLLYPGWVSMASEGGYTSYFGIPVLLTTYNGAVVQIILSVWIMSKIDTVLKRIIPGVVKHFLKPFILLVVMSVITLSLTGPLGGLLTNYVSQAIDALRGVAPWACIPAVAFFSCTAGLLVPGFHLALIPIATASLATVGYDDFINVWWFCGTPTVGFFALAIALMSKSNNCKQVAVPGGLSSLLGGISEPAMYGLLYRLPRIYAAYVGVVTIAAVAAGLLHLKCYAFGGYSVANILLYLGPNMDYANFYNALGILAFEAVASFIAVRLMGFDDSIFETQDEDDVSAGIDVEGSNTLASAPVENVTIVRPLEGEVLSQREIADDVFAAGILGDCFGVRPRETDGEVTVNAPVSGKVVMVAESKHAVGLQTDGGAEILIHVGIDSVVLSGEGMKSFVRVGQQVKTGDALISFDAGLFAARGINPTTVIILSNSSSYRSVSFERELGEMTALV